MQVLKWHLSDQKTLFEYHYKNFPEIFQAYADNPITYSINSDGFRSDFEFSPDKKLKVDLYLGCSHTLGSGHYWENTWPFIVSQYTGNIIVNLAEGGSGIERAFFNLLKYRNYFCVENIFHHQPIYPRYDFIDHHSTDFWDNKPFRFFPFQPAWDGDDPSYYPYTEQYINRVLLSDRFMYYNHIKYIMSIQGIAHELKVPYYFHYSYPQTSWEPRVVFEYDFVGVNKLGRKLEGIVKTNGYIPPKHDLIARDSTHFTQNAIKGVADEMVHLKKQYPEGFVHKIPYMEKIFPKNSP